MRFFILTIFVTIIAIVVISCGDIFQRQIHMSGNYYLQEGDDGFAVYFLDWNGDGTGRIPPRIIEYGFDHNFIVAKCKVNDSLKIFVVDRKRDSLYAEPASYLIGPLTLGQCDSVFHSQNLQIKFRKP